jgi:hypothetical protein
MTATRGQALLEYSVLVWLLAIALLLGVTLRVIPAPAGAEQALPHNLLELFVWALHTYLDSYFFVLEQPFS